MMNITLKLSPDIERKLRESIARQDAKSLRQLLAQAFAPTVEQLLLKQSSELKSVIPNH